eukprot:c21243_g1_i1 orf=117-1613(+)
MGLGSLDCATTTCCFPAKTPCSLAPFNRRLRNPLRSDRITLSSRLVVCLSSVELRLQDPLDTARRPSLPFDDDDRDEDEDEDEDAEGIEEHDYRSSTNGSSHGQACSPNGSLTSHLDSAAPSQINERERIRRERISAANKGKTPWNKGKHHSPETIARLRERNKIVMQDPKIREKLRQCSHPQSQETREKLRIFMKARMQFERRQLTIVQEWKDSIAGMARVGFLGDEELEWNSYIVLKQELRRQYYASTKKKKEKVPRSWTFEQRVKISESVRAKWADPEYRKRVVKSIQQTRQKGQGPRKINKKLSDTEFDNLLDILTSEPFNPVNGSVGSPYPKVGSYNDPQSEEKLNKIKLLRVRNVSQKESELDTETASVQSQVSKVGTYTDPLSEKKLEKINMLRPQKGKQKEIGETSVASTLEPVQMAEMAALQKAQREATEKARILLAEAERAAVLAAQALDAAGAHDESLSHSLLEAWTMLDEANKSILNMEVGSSSIN